MLQNNYWTTVNNICFLQLWSRLSSLFVVSLYNVEDCTLYLINLNSAINVLRITCFEKMRVNLLHLIDLQNICQVTIDSFTKYDFFKYSAMQFLTFTYHQIHKDWIKFKIILVSRDLKYEMLQWFLETLEPVVTQLTG